MSVVFSFNGQTLIPSYVTFDGPKVFVGKVQKSRAKISNHVRNTIFGINRLISQKVVSHDVKLFILLHTKVTEHSFHEQKQLCDLFINNFLLYV